MTASRITVCGLGPGSREALPVGVIEVLRQAGVVFLRTEKHPVVPFLKEEGVRFSTFDRFYEAEESFEKVYRRIADAVLETARTTPVVYAVPGHPLVAEEPSRLIIEGAEKEGLSVRVLPAMSFLEAVYAALRLDPARGMVVLDGLNLNQQKIVPSLPTIIMQVYNRLVASEVKLFLLDHYPDEHRVTVIRAAGVPGAEERAAIPLYELDHVRWFDHLTSVYLPPIAAARKAHYSVEPLVRVMATLRGEQGCPWDKEQTHQSLKKYLLEEAYEVLEAIERGKPHNLCEELGDLLLQIVFHCQIAAETGAFNFADIVETIVKKMVYRHPHVFGEARVEDSKEVSVNWEQLKKAQKSDRSLLDGIPKALSALLRAARVQGRVAQVGFDWEDWHGALAKVQEETAELAAAAETSRGTAAEIGDLLFAVVNVARLLGVEAEDALNRSTEKFIRRFKYIEARAREKGVKLQDLALVEMDTWWEEAKKLEKI